MPFKFAFGDPASFEPFVPKAGQYSMDMWRPRALGQDSPFEVDGEIIRSYATSLNTGYVIHLCVKQGYVAKDIRSQIQSLYPECNDPIVIFHDYTSNPYIWRVVSEDVDLLEFIRFLDFVVYDKNAPEPRTLGHITTEAFVRLRELGFPEWFKSVESHFGPLHAPFDDVDKFLKTQGSNLEEFMSVYRV
jgi:hypothetical protein